MKILIKFFKIFINEFYNIISTLISFYPDTFVGIGMRNWWFGRQFKSRKKKINLMQGFRVSYPRQITVGNRFSCNINNYLNCGGAGCNGIYIGDDVTLGPNVYVRTINHSYKLLNKDIRDQGYDEKKIFYNSNYYSIIIEGNNWIGANCVILPGSFIKKGAIIGAGSVVSGLIKGNSVYIPSPIKFAFKR